MNDVDLARQMKLLAEDAEEVRKELAGGTARGLTPGLHQALKNLLQSTAQIRTTWEASLAVEKNVPRPATEFRAICGKCGKCGESLASWDAVARHDRERHSRPPPAVPAKPAAAAPGSAERPRKRRKLTEEGRARLAAAMAARWNDPGFRAKHAAAMASKKPRGWR